MALIPRALFLLAVCAIQQVTADTWCGKNYQAGSPVVAPGGEFPTPGTSESPLLAFRCASILKPYLEEDTTAGVIIDAQVTNTLVQGAQNITLSNDSSPLTVSISIGGNSVANASVPLNATKFEIPFSLSGLKTQVDPYNVTCTAGYANGQTFSASASLSYLPNPTGGSITKMDSRTGGLLNKRVGDSEYTTVFPVGFYTDFDGYLASNLSVLDDLKNQGIDIVHIVPTFDNMTAFNAVLDKMDQLGLYLMYDMRFTYMNTSSLTDQVNSIKSRKSLLLWYTGDEPDGTSDPLNATTIAYDQIYSLDSGYHPVSLVLNCQNYRFDVYTAGTDIVMQDTYPIGVNMSYSVRWNTTCTPDFGDCGCDNCVGEFEDISNRMDDFKQRLWDLGWDRTKAVWTVPQAFGASEYWSVVPTGKEWVVENVLAFNHGGIGSVSWNDPTTADIKSSASSISKNLSPYMVKYALDPTSTFASYIANRVDVGLWTVGTETLVLATNLNYNQTTLSLSSLPGGGKGDVKQVLDSGASYADGTITFESVGSGAFVLTSA